MDTLTSLRIANIYVDYLVEEIYESGLFDILALAYIIRFMKRNKNTAILIFIAFTGTMGFGIISPILPLYVRSMGATGVMVGLVSSVFMLSRALTSLFSGDFLKKIKISRGNSIKIFSPFMAVLTAAYALIPVYGYIITLRFIHGLVNGVIWPSAQYLTIKSAKKGEEARTMSLYYIFGNVGGFLSKLLLPVFILMLNDYMHIPENGQYPFLFIIASIFMTIPVISSFFLSTEKKTVESPKEVKNNKKMAVSTMILLFAAMLGGAILTTSNSILILYLKEHFGSTLKDISLILFVTNIISFPFIYLISHIVDRGNERFILPVIFALTFAATIILSFAWSIGAVILSLILMYIGLKSFRPVLRVLINRDNENFNSLIGYINAIENTGSIIGPIIAGFIYDKFTNQLSSFGIYGSLMLFSYMLYFIRKITAERT
ncbi:MAG: MFS transporter [Proteobacteria bacterium]|nr:MFS transporter [Pseudomonadota bacterium]